MGGCGPIQHRSLAKGIVVGYRDGRAPPRTVAMGVSLASECRAVYCALGSRGGGYDHEGPANEAEREDLLDWASIRVVSWRDLRDANQAIG